MLNLLTGISSLILLGATVAALWWVYRQTRQTAVLVYLIWIGPGSMLLAQAMKLLVDAAVRAPLPGLTVGELVALASLFTQTAGTGLLLWMLIALIRWARPGIGLPWQSGRAAAVAVPEQ